MGQTIQIHLLGDSIVKNYGSDSDNFIGGWGDHLQSFFDTDHIRVLDYAMGGRSTRSFLNEGRFTDNGNHDSDSEPKGLGPAFDRINPGDYVFMEFAHNDDQSKSKQTMPDRLVRLGNPDLSGIYPVVTPDESMKIKPVLPESYAELLKEEGFREPEIEDLKQKYTAILEAYGESYYPFECAATYKGYLTYYIDLIRKKGGIPVLVTPVSRLFFKENRIEPIQGHHGGIDKFGPFPYVRAIRQLASEENVLLLDLFAATVELFEMLGEDDAMYLQSIKDGNGQTIGEARYGRPAVWVSDYDRIIRENAFSEFDRAHQNRFGSFLVAGKLAECILNLDNHPLSRYMTPAPQKKIQYPESIRNRIPEIISSFNRINITDSVI